MKRIDDMKWNMDHFEPCRLEREARHVTIEILKTVVVCLFGLLVIGMVW